VTQRHFETAYAKINLALHVRRRRQDGYHELETVFAFLDQGDRLAMSDAAQFELVQTGTFADHTGSIEDNLITRAAKLVHAGHLPPKRFDLDKVLPVAAGLGGGSADAAAALRLMGAGECFDIAAKLGADVPACLASLPLVGRGIGTELEPIENDVSGLGCVLVNPLIPLSTGPVFKAWGGEDKGAMPGGSAREIMLAGRNDLEVPAISLCPIIGDILEVLRLTSPLVARMSGSGATCFAVFETLDQAEEVAAQIGSVGGQKCWTMAGRLR
jgi:4-diphosphocytidyl-2-C-methyl-D-erythritol kinase